MEIQVNDDKKYVSVWLTGSEASDAAVRRQLEPLYGQYRARSYRVVVFESGTCDLPTLTRDLLRHSLELCARRDRGQDCR